ncbi:MAG: aldo/keto reductase [Ignavibacteriales bacterium]|nr:aldo/keto reductase [Ignavibacteriales bacterium]
MNYRTLGRTQLRVSEIGLGALEIGRDWPYWRKAESDFSRPDEKEAISLVHEALDLGINFIDTAPAYFRSEELLGKALKGKRHDVVLATKCGEWFDGQNSVYDYSAEATGKFIESSLKKLQADHVDVLQIHSGNHDVIRRGETLEAMKKAQQEGKARFLGISLDSVEAARAALENGEFDCIQVSYNILRRSMESEVLPMALDRKIGVIVKDGLATGKLTSKYEHLSDVSLREALSKKEEAASQLGITIAEYAIRFVLSQSLVSTVILGTKKAEHLRANVRCSDESPITGIVREKENVTSPH